MADTDMNLEDEGWIKSEPAPAWDPQKAGDKIMGLLIAKDTNIGPNSSNLYTLKLKDGSQMAVWGSSVLDNHFKGIDLGEEVLIIFKGKMASQQRKGATYKVFEVYHRAISDTAKTEDEDIDINDIPV